MLKLFETLPGTSVLSLRVGGTIAVVRAPIINPNNLYIEGWYVEDSRSKQLLVLLSQDIRDVLPQGFVVNDHEVLSEVDELVRLKNIIDIQFELLKLRVTSESGKNYGKVTDFAIETDNFFIQKLYVGQPLIKSLSGGTLSIDRSQIIEITNRRIIIEDPTVPAKVPIASPVGQ